MNDETLRQRIRVDPLVMRFFDLRPKAHESTSALDRGHV